MVRILGLFLVAILTMGCDKKDAEAKGSDWPPVEPSVDASAYIENLYKFLDADMVVSLKNGEITDRGDSALFTGLAIASLSCRDGEDLFNALIKDIEDHNGLIYRHPNLEAQTIENDGPSSRDALIGASVGLISRYARCPGDRITIHDTWKLHRDYVEGLGQGRLYPGAGEDKQINGGLFWLWDRTANYFGVTDSAPRVSKDRFQADLLGTASGIVSTKAACYPLHINMLQMFIAYQVGSPVTSFTRSAWCSITKGTDIPMAEWFCERAPAKDWLSTYNPDGGYVYRHQKCKWQDKDSPDTRGPSVDFLVLKALADHTIF